MEWINMQHQNVNNIINHETKVSIINGSVCELYNNA